MKLLYFLFVESLIVRNDISYQRVNVIQPPEFGRRQIRNIRTLEFLIKKPSYYVLIPKSIEEDKHAKLLMTCTAIVQYK